MFKYTPKKAILKQLLKARKKGYNMKTCSSYEYDMARALTKGDYSLTWRFMRYWEHVCFFSQTKRKEIPVNGVLFPVDLFEETSV